jgi:glycosyltransferase involved in cell wall biosynthesis
VANLSQATLRENGSRNWTTMDLPGELIVAIDARLIGGTSTGDSTYWTGLLHGLAHEAPNETLLFISNTEKPPGIPWSEKWRWITAPARSQRVWSLITFPRVATRNRAQVVHTQYNLSPLVRRGGITTIHDVSFFIGPQWFGPKDRLLLQRFVPSSARRSARVITVSDSSRAEIERFIPVAKGKVSVTPLATPPWVEKMDRTGARRVVNKLVGVEERFVLTIGTDWPRKNQTLAVEAVNRLPEDSDLKLYLVGKSPAPTGENARIRRLGYVPQSDLAALYSAAEALVFPSLHEGFGLPILEAFTCGCPVLCGAGGAMPETAAYAARIVHNYEPQTWADALQDMVSSNLDALREAGFMRAAEFSWLETARLTLQVYREVAAQSTQSS